MYAAEAIIPVKVQSSFRTQNLKNSGDPGETQFNLNQADYLRKQASIRIAIYRNKMSQMFNSHVKPQVFNVGNLVLRRSNVTGDSAGVIPG